MRSDLATFKLYQVFLNYPFDEEFEQSARAIHFAVAAAGFVPVCARDLTSPDRPRLEILVDAIVNCRYSVHDLSRGRGEGDGNFARMNMPIEMGMALFHALQTQRAEHRCAFLVPQAHDYQRFASDLAGLDPRQYDDDTSLVGTTYEWLRDVSPLANREATIRVGEKYEEFKTSIGRIRGGGRDGAPTHDEFQELIFKMCSDCGWWDLRANRMGRGEFPEVPLSWNE